MEQQQFDLKNAIRGLEVGQTMEQPIGRLAVVRQYTYLLRLVDGKVYTTHVDRDRHVVSITRSE